MKMTRLQRSTAGFTFGLALTAAPTAFAQQPGVRPPSGTGTTTAAQAAARVAAVGTPTTTAMTGTPVSPAIVLKGNVAGPTAGKAATATTNPGTMPLVNGKPAK